MATKRSCRWPHVLHPASILPYNTGDWMNFANRHPLQIFSFLPTSSHQSGEYPDSCLEDSFMTIFPILSTLSSSGSCHIYETMHSCFISLKTLSAITIITCDYFSATWKVTFQFYPVWKQVYLFLLTKSSWLAEIAGVMLAYQDLFFASGHSGIYLSASSRDGREHGHWFYTACCYNCNCQLSTKLLLANGGSCKCM